MLDSVAVARKNPAIAADLKARLTSEQYTMFMTGNITSYDAFDDIAKKRGLLEKGGIPNYEKVYGVIIKDLKDGNFGNITFDR